MKQYFIYSLVLVVIGTIIFTVLEKNTKQKIPGKLDRLPCHKKITCFERAYDIDKISEAKKLLLNGNYKINSDMDKSQFMKSTLFDFIDLKTTDKYFYNSIDTKSGKTRSYNNGTIVDYTVFENDIKDPKKKSDNCKLYRGYVVLKIKNSNNKLLYQDQIDFMDYEGKDIFKTLDCSLESFLTY